MTRPRVLMPVINPMTADTRVEKQAASLAAAGYDVTVLATASGALPTIEERDGYTIHRLPYERVFKDRIVQRRAREARRNKSERRLLRAARIHRPATDRRWRTFSIATFRLALVFARELVSRVRWAIGGGFLKLVRSRILVFEYWRGTVSRVPDLIERCDVIHAHDLGPVAASIRLADAWARRNPDQPRPRVVYDAHEYYVEQTTKWTWLEKFLWRLHAQRWIRRADRVITVSDGIAEAMKRRYRLRELPVVLFNAPEGDATVPSTSDVRRDAGVSSDDILAVYVGAVKEGRGVEHLVPALAVREGWHLALVGPGKDAHLQQVVRAAEAAGVAHRLHVLGKVPAATLPGYLRTADVGVHPMEPICANHDLALPNKLFDYAFARLPVAVTDLQEMGRFVREHGVGRTFDAADPASVADAVLAAAQDPSLRPDADTEAAIMARYGWHAQAEKLLDIYAHVAPAPRVEAVSIGEQDPKHG